MLANEANASDDEEWLEVVYLTGCRPEEGGERGSPSPPSSARDRSISRHHTELTLDSSSLTLRNMASRLGTYLDGRELETALRYPAPPVPVMLYRN